MGYASHTRPTFYQFRYKLTTGKCGVEIFGKVLANYSPHVEHGVGNIDIKRRMKGSSEMAEKKAILDMMSFGCPSCAYTVERLGKKIPGIEAIRVDLSKHEIRVEYDGDDSVLEAVCDIVNRIGHDAKIRR